MVVTIVEHCVKQEQEVDSPLDARSESYTPEVLRVLLRGVSAQTNAIVTKHSGQGSADCRAEHAQYVLLSPLAMPDGVSVLLPLDRPSLLGVLETLRPAGPPGATLI